MKIYQDNEFNKIICEVSNNKEFQKLKKVKHHGINRYEHSVRVAYYTYKITKILHLDYKESTIAALLHDFFQEEVSDKNFVVRLRKHPGIAVKNATQYFKLNEKQIDIIKTHMFPIGKKVPKYLESWIVDLVDDVASIYEKSFMIKANMKLSFNLIVMLLVMFRR